MHLSVIVTVKGVPLGVNDLEIWTREPTKNQEEKESKSLQEKESKRWLKGLVDAELMVKSSTQLVIITDREGDIYEIFAIERKENSRSYP